MVEAAEESGSCNGCHGSSTGLVGPMIYRVTLVDVSNGKTGTCFRYCASCLARFKQLVAEIPEMEE